MVQHSFPTEQQTGYLSDKLHGKSHNTERNVNTARDIIFDVIKPNDTRKITCPLNVVQYISFVDSLSICMLEWQ